MAVVVFEVGVVQVAVREVLQPMEPVAHSVPAHLDQDILIQLQILNMDEVEAVMHIPQRHLLLEITLRIMAGEESSPTTEETPQELVIAVPREQSSFATSQQRNLHTQNHQMHISMQV